MLHKTRGIILRQIKYSENSIIVQVFTELFGRQAYIVSGVRGKKSKNKINFFQPLHIVEMDIYYKASREMQRISEVKSLVPFTSITQDPLKSSQAIFLAELLLKSIREEEKDINLFEFVVNSIQFLDLTKENPANFHLVFMLKLTRFLGFFPNEGFNEMNNLFNLRSGSFCCTAPDHDEYISKELTFFFQQLLNIPLKNFYTVILNSRSRSKLMRNILDYYYLHIGGMPEIKSFSVLTEVFSDI